MFIIYKTTNLINGKIYVGKHTMDRDDYLGSGNLLKRAVKKYGSENFVRETLENCGDNLELLNEREKYWIEKLNSTNLEIGYNIANGSVGGDLISNNPNRDDIIFRMRETLIEYYRNLSEEDKLKLKKFGEDNPNFGNLWNEEQRKNLSEIKKEYYKDNDHVLKGKTFEEYFGDEIAKERKQFLSELASSKTGDKNPFYGKHHTEEFKNYLHELFKDRKPVNIKPFKIDDIEYLSLMDASKELNIPTTTIRWRILSKNPKYINYNYI